MTPSQLNSLVVPTAGSQAPATLFKAADVPLRVLVRNLGPNTALLAHDVGTLSNAPVYANTFRLPVNMSEVFVLAPKQGLYAVAVGTAGQLSVAVSEALPAKVE